MNQQVGWATMRALLVAASLALTLLAGCSGEVPMLTAKDTLPAADEAAALWADDAALAAVMTFELGDDIKSMIRQEIDRKSTRLNSSHSQISYAVLRLKKKIPGL